MTNLLKFKMFLDNSLTEQEYLRLLVFLIFSIVLTIVIISISYLVVNQNPDSEKLSAYECGFEPYEDSRHVFDLQFCLIAILFLIFDIEIMFLIPWCTSIAKLDLLGFWIIVDFLVELSIGFFYVWYTGALKWN